MRPFRFQFGDVPWPPGTRLRHVYALLDPRSQPSLGKLVEGVRETLDGWPISWQGPVLHLTLEQLPRPVPDAREYPAESESWRVRSRLWVNQLRLIAAKFPAFSVSVGSPLAFPGGVIADVDPDDWVLWLHRALRIATRDWWGPGPHYQPGVPYVALGYANAEASTDEIAHLIRQVRPSHAKVTIDAIHVVDVSANHDTQELTWDVHAICPLRGRRHLAAQPGGAQALDPPIIRSANGTGSPIPAFWLPSDELAEPVRATCTTAPYQPGATPGGSTNITITMDTTGLTFTSHTGRTWRHRWVTPPLPQWLDDTQRLGSVLLLTSPAEHAASRPVMNKLRDGELAWTRIGLTRPASPNRRPPEPDGRSTAGGP